MKVTFLLPDYPWRPTGGSRVVYEYANQLVRHGHDVTVVHARYLRNAVTPVTYSPICLLRKAVTYTQNVMLKPAVRWQHIDKRIIMLYVPELKAKYVPDADIIFATSWHTAEYLARYPQSKGARFYLIQHYEIWSGPKERVDATWRMPFKKVVIARWLYEKGIELGVKSHEMRIIPNGIDCEKFKLIKDIHLRTGRIAMMYHAFEWKGSADGIAAIETVRKKYPSIQAVLFGVIKRTAEIPDWFEYRFNPPQKDLVEEIYNGSSIYVSPSWTEGFTLPPAEAMACGCALVSTDIGGVKEYAEDGVTALLSPPKDPARLAGNITKLLDDDDLRMRLAQKGYERITGFTWKKSGDMLERYITDTISQ